MYAAASVPDIVPRFDYRVTTASAEDRGKIRDKHQDVHRIAIDLAMFAVADGMGGHSAGDVAARIAIDEVERSLRGGRAQRAIEGWVTTPDLETRRRVFQRLREAVERANARVREEASTREDYSNMGTTLDVVWLARGHAFVAHAGDGRVYLARTSAMLQLTQDHAQLEALKATGLVHAARKQRSQNRLLNAVGLSDSITVDTLFVDLSRGDRILICTDGIHGQIDSEAELTDLLRRPSAESAAQALVARAGLKGRDNATALVVEINDRFVVRETDDRGLAASDLERARATPLLQDLPMPGVLAALAAAVEVEISKDDIVPRVVASDLVCYIVLDGMIRYADDRRVGVGALLFPESLVGVTSGTEPPVCEERTRLLRLRADDFNEVCQSDPELSSELYRRLARHLARAGARLSGGRG